jgi:peptidoglycan/LPS O-acetylase OafA/YrhL
MTGQGQKVEVVEGLRGIAALSVAWFHFTHGNRGFLDEGIIKATGTYGWVGLYIFFVISGFVIPYSMDRAGYEVRWDFSRYLTKRFIRLEPPYIICIILTILLWYLSAATPWFRGSPPEWSITQVMLHFGYLVPFFDEVWLSPVFWSLAIEFQFYIALGLMFPLMVSRSGLVRFSALTAMCLSSLIVHEKYLFVSYLGLFSIGILTFQFYARLIGPVAFVASATLASLVVALTQDPVTAVAGLLTGIVIAFRGQLRIGWLAYLGTISYSLYLLHVPIGGRVINLGDRFAVGVFDQVLVLMGALLVSIASAHVFCLFVERPSRSLSARIKYSDRARRIDKQQLAVTSTSDATP